LQGNESALRLAPIGFPLAESSGQVHEVLFCSTSKSADIGPIQFQIYLSLSQSSVWVMSLSLKSGGSDQVFSKNEAKTINVKTYFRISRIG
jgi:hypothetical protein